MQMKSLLNYYLYAPALMYVPVSTYVSVSTYRCTCTNILLSKAKNKILMFILLAKIPKQLQLLADQVSLESQDCKKYWIRCTVRSLLISSVIHYLVMQLLFCKRTNEPRYEKTGFFAYAKTKTQISVFVFAIRIEQSLYYLNQKFHASSHLLWLYSPVCVGPGQNPRKPFFSQRGSN